MATPQGVISAGQAQMKQMQDCHPALRFKLEVMCFGEKPQLNKEDNLQEKCAWMCELEAAAARLRYNTPAGDKDACTKAAAVAAPPPCVQQVVPPGLRQPSQAHPAPKPMARLVQPLATEGMQKPLGFQPPRVPAPAAQEQPARPKPLLRPPPSLRPAQATTPATPPGLVPAPASPPLAQAPAVPAGAEERPASLKNLLQPPPGLGPAPATLQPMAPPTPAAEDGLPPPLKPLRPLPPGTTTLVVRNIPARFNQERMLQEWPLDGTFNFLYLPYNALERRPKGYAFINFLTPELALAFQREWHGNYLSETGRTKHLDVAASVVQGVREILETLLVKDFEKLGKRGNLPALFFGTRRVNTEEVLKCMWLDLERSRMDYSSFPRISL